MSSGKRKRNRTAAAAQRPAVNVSPAAAEEAATGRRSWGRAASAVALACALALGSRLYSGGEVSAAPAGGQGAAPTVVYSSVMRADLAVAREYVGRVEAMQTVSLKAQVSGQIEKVHFAEGAMVKAGDTLFTIDKSTYQATVDLRKADIASAEAALAYAEKYHNRLKASDKRSVPATELEQAESRVTQGRAAVAQAKAALKLAEIDLDRCTVKAPITGRIGRAEATRGNYVSPSGDPLAVIVQTDPIRVSFAMPDRDYLEQAAALTAGKDSVYNSTITLADGSVYPNAGERDFENNTMDNSTGTITMNLKFKNDKGILVPGGIVRVSTKPREPRISEVVPQEAITADTRGDFVYVVKDDNTVERRDVELGDDIGTMTEVRSGLKDGERVVIRGIQSIRDGMAVSPNPEKAAGEGMTPAEQAKESTYDLTPLSPDADVDSEGPAAPASEE